MANYISAHYLIAPETGFQAKRLVYKWVLLNWDECYPSHNWSRLFHTHCVSLLFSCICNYACELTNMDLICCIITFRRYCKLEIACIFLRLGNPRWLWSLLNHLWRVVCHQRNISLIVSLIVEIVMDEPSFWTYTFESGSFVLMSLNCI